MGADVNVVIIDPTEGAVVFDGWIGRNATRDRVHEVLRRPPAHQATGYASWGEVTAVEARHISETHYAEGVGPTDIDALALAFPSERFWWAVIVDY
jgi:hypothetical protein